MAVGIKVGEVMRKAVVTAKKEDSVDKAARIMKKAKVGSVVVCGKGKVIGILTEGDIVKKILAAGKDYKKTSVGAVMMHPIQTISKSLDIEDAANIMRDLEISKLPVVENGKLVGLISERDMVKMEPALLELMLEKGNLEHVGPAHRDITIAGYCESCKNYSDNLRFIETRYLCDDCRRL